MSITIKGVKKPTMCKECPFCRDNEPDYECIPRAAYLEATHDKSAFPSLAYVNYSSGKPFDFRPAWCPIEEVEG